MDKCETLIELLMEMMREKVANVGGDIGKIPVGISNRHIHLSQKDSDILFGEGNTLTKLKELSQPKQYACKEVVTLCGPKGAIENVRVLGPVRDKTQVEVLVADCFKLGVQPVSRLSGDLEETPGITVIGKKNSIQLREGVITAKRHIHMTTEEADKLGVCNGQIVSIRLDGIKGGVYDNVVIRANKESALECHLDTEEANAMGISTSAKVTIIK